MSGPALYCYPIDGDGDAGALVRIDFPTGVYVAGHEEAWDRTRLDALPPGGLLAAANYGVHGRLTISVEGLTEAAHPDFLARLSALDSYLSLGSVCHFTFDRTYAGVWKVVDAYPATALDVPAQGDTTIYYAPSAELLGLEVSPALATDDVAHIITEPPESHRSTARISGTGTGYVTLAVGIFGPSVATKAILHHWRFYPGLVLAQEELRTPRLERSSAVTWRWTATFVQSPARIFDLVTEIA